MHSMDFIDYRQKYLSYTKSFVAKFSLSVGRVGSELKIHSFQFEKIKKEKKA